jgi:hypothetical protein
MNGFRAESSPYRRVSLASGEGESVRTKYWRQLDRLGRTLEPVGTRDGSVATLAARQWLARVAIRRSAKQLELWRGQAARSWPPCSFRSPWQSSVRSLFVSLFDSFLSSLQDRTGDPTQIMGLTPRRKEYRTSTLWYSYAVMETSAVHIGRCVTRRLSSMG